MSESDYKGLCAAMKEALETISSALDSTQKENKHYTLSDLKGIADNALQKAKEAEL